METNLISWPRTKFKCSKCNNNPEAVTTCFSAKTHERELKKKILTLILDDLELNEEGIGEGQFKEGFKFAKISLELKKDEIRKALEILEGDAK